MAWPSTVVAGQTATAGQYNALVAGLQTWGGDVDAGNYSLKNVANVETQLFTANGGAGQGTPLLVTSASSGGTSSAIENTATGGHRFAWTASPGASAWLTLADVTAGQGLIAFATAGANARSTTKLPAVGVIGFAAGNNLPSDTIDVGIQRTAAGVLQVSDSNGADRDLRARHLAVSGHADFADYLNAFTVSALSPQGSYLSLVHSSPSTAGQAVYIRASGPVYFDNQPLLSLNVNTPSLRVGSPMPSFDRYMEVKAAGTSATVDFTGALTGLSINGLLTVQGRVTLNTDVIVNPKPPGANYFQILNNGQFGRPNPILYSATAVVDVQSALYVSQNIYAVSTVSGSAWTAHGSGTTLAEVRDHMRQARTERAADAKEEDETALIPVGAVNFVADAEGFHLIGKRAEGEIWEAVIPWMSEREPR